MKRKLNELNETKPLIIKLRKRYTRYSDSAWGCLHKKYPVIVAWHRFDQRAIGHRFKDSEAAGQFFNLPYYKVHKYIQNSHAIGDYILVYEKFL